MSCGICLPSSCFSASDEKCSPWAWPVVCPLLVRWGPQEHPIPAMALGQLPKHLEEATWLAVVYAGWSQEGVCGRGAWHVLFNWFSGCLPALCSSPLIHHQLSTLPPFHTSTSTSSSLATAFPSFSFHLLLACRICLVCVYIARVHVVPPVPFPEQEHHQQIQFLPEAMTGRGICFDGICSLNYSFLSPLGKRSFKVRTDLH